jgi:radical SAM protein with 4Fe4S-binding SPASM domain
MRAHRFHLNVTEKCNIRCVHCYWEAYGQHPDPSMETIEKILAEFKKLGKSYGERGRHVLTIGGGEPTIRKDLPEIIRLAVRRRFRVRLVTNAVIITDEMAADLKKAGLKIAQVSLDGACEATHDSIRGKGNWARSMRGIAALKKAGIFVVLSYVLLPGVNMDEAPLLLDLAQKLRVAGAKFARPVREGQAIIHKVVVDGDYFGTFKRIVEHATEIRYRRLLLFFDPLAHLLRVEQPKHTKSLWGLATDLCQCDNTELCEVNGSTGDVYYCRIRYKLGNLWQQNLTQLWRSHPVLVGLRRKSAAGVGACDGCSTWKSCRGGCPAVVHGNTGLTLVQDADCHKVQQQPALIQFGQGLMSNTRPANVGESLRVLGKQLRDVAYFVALR